MAKKGTVAWKREYTASFYGINMHTFEVESVSLQRDGTLSQFTKGGGYLTHGIVGNRMARNEVTIVFNLIEVEEVSIQLDTPERSKEIRARLEAKAEKLKAEHEASKEKHTGKKETYPDLVKGRNRALCRFSFSQ